MFLKIPLYIRRQLIVALCVNLGDICIGCTIAWTAPVIPKLMDVQQSPLQEVITLAQASWLGSGYFAGGIIGPICFAKLSNEIGRKRCLLTVLSLSIVGHITLTLAKNFAAVLAGRVICGFRQGTIAVISLVYLGEISSPRIRGTILSSTAIFHTFGIMLTYSIGPFVSYQWVQYINLLLSGLYFIGLLCIPESPLFHILKGKKDAAITVLENLGRGENIEREIKSLTKNAAQMTSSKIDFKEVFTVKSNRKSFIITTALYIFQECSGILGVANFLMTIFQKAATSIEPAIATVIIGITQFIVSMIAPIFIDFVGRKTLLLVSTAGCALFMGLLGTYFYLDFISYAHISVVSWLPVVAMVGMFSAFGIGLNIVPNTLLAEMYRPNARSMGTSISMSLGWAAGVVSILCYGYLVQALAPFVVFFIYAAVNVAAFTFVCFVVPETKRLTLTEIENMLSK